MFIKPEEAINNFELRHGMTVADFGSGSGHYILPIARRIGSSGIVYALDIQKNLLEKIKSEAEKNHISNVEIIWADIEGKDATKLANGSIDFIVASNILFQISDKNVIPKEAFRVLKKGGRIAVIDWDKTVPGLGPSAGNLVVKTEAERLFLQEGFLEEKEFSAGDNHYGIIFRK